MNLVKEQSASVKNEKAIKLEAEEYKFIENVEKAINPAEVSNLYFFQGFRKYIPNFLFKALLDRTSRKTPRMGFVIDPYCLFHFFKLKDIDAAQAMLPERYELTKACIFDGDEPQYYFGMGTFNTKASTFWGVRQEMYLIARDRETGLLSWIFIDIISNTLISLPTVGVASPNSNSAMYTTNGRGDIFMDIREAKSDRRFQCTGNVRNGEMRALEQNLWLMGNTSIAHSKKLGGSIYEEPFAVVFDPDLVKEALDIPVEDIQVKINTLFPGLAEAELHKVACFPYSQHYVADSPGCRTYVKDRADMIEKYRDLAAQDGIPTYSTKGIRTLFFGGIIFTSCAAVWLLLMQILGL
ncbi:MAG: hypothetical protein PQJ58_17860 [Spirochaetales bacterium]|nr:hypothetical protein [Spirochaetales bacterium]